MGGPSTLGVAERSEGRPVRTSTIATWEHRSHDPREKVRLCLSSNGSELAMSSNRSAGSGRSTSSLALTSRWTSLDGGLLMRRIIALDLDQNRDYSLDCDPRTRRSLGIR